MLKKAKVSLSVLAKAEPQVYGPKVVKPPLVPQLGRNVETTLIKTARVRLRMLAIQLAKVKKVNRRIKWTI
jgi:hypothetical protein